MTQADLFDICENNHGGDAQSAEAHGRTNKDRDRARIVEYLRTVNDATCDQVEVALGMAHQTCSARFSELKRDGVIVKAGRRETRTGCTAQAWALA